MLLDLIYHNTVRSVRKGHRDALFAILNSMIQTAIMVAVFYLLYDILGMRRNAIRGDYMLYIMSGISVFMVHVKAMAAVATAEGPTSPMMQHLPMNTTIAIWSAAFSALYVQIISLGAIIALYNYLWSPITIADPVGALGTLGLAWFSGVAVGSVVLAIKPWSSGASGILQQLYSRINMFASGKMFVANQMPARLVAMFSWNPLYHIIDQGRGFIFINYTPLKSNLEYPITMSCLLLAIGLIGEGYARRHVSLSWSAGK